MNTSFLDTLLMSSSEVDKPFPSPHDLAQKVNMLEQSFKERQEQLFQLLFQKFKNEYNPKYFMVNNILDIFMQLSMDDNFPTVTAGDQSSNFEASILPSNWKDDLPIPIRDHIHENDEFGIELSLITGFFPTKKLILPNNQIDDGIQCEALYNQLLEQRTNLKKSESISNTLELSKENKGLAYTDARTRQRLKSYLDDLKIKQDPDSKTTPVAATIQAEPLIKNGWKELPHNFLSDAKLTALTFPFTLDPFQKAGCAALEYTQSNLLVVASTSAGKSVFAEYAIGLTLNDHPLASNSSTNLPEKPSDQNYSKENNQSVRDPCSNLPLTLGKRVIYTSPIKALSNQKYREFNARFSLSKDIQSLPTILQSIKTNSSTASQLNRYRRKLDQSTAMPASYAGRRTNQLAKVGILTGDVQMNVDAPCLLMTTEILLNTLYNRATYLDDVSFVIFDEAHYMNDPERGVVWEELLMHLPGHIRIILLSASISHAGLLASWLARIRQREMLVLKQEGRPVPLQYHFYLPANLSISDSTSNVKQGSSSSSQSSGPMKKGFLHLTTPGGPLQSSVYERLCQLLRDVGKPKMSQSSLPKSNLSQSLTDGKWPSTFLQLLQSMLSKADECNMLPMVCFAFSRKKLIDTFRGLLGLGCSFLSVEEKKKVRDLWRETLLKISFTHRQKIVFFSLPQVHFIRSGLEVGIGLHHSGLHPTLKELVELSLAKGLVRVLLATETFAMGLDAPVKCVTFLQLRKIDPLQSQLAPNGADTFDPLKIRFSDEPPRFRPLLVSEFQQMAGRAGRRGRDPLGHVVLLPSTASGSSASKNPLFNMDLPSPLLLRNYIAGTPEPIKSPFRLSARLVLYNLRAREDMSRIWERCYLYAQVTGNQIATSLPSSIKNNPPVPLENQQEFGYQCLQDYMALVFFLHARNFVYPLQTAIIGNSSSLSPKSSLHSSASDDSATNVDEKLDSAEKISDHRASCALTAKGHAALLAKTLDEILLVEVLTENIFAGCSASEIAVLAASLLRGEGKFPVRSVDRLASSSTLQDNDYEGGRYSSIPETVCLPTPRLTDIYVKMSDLCLSLYQQACLYLSEPDAFLLFHPDAALNAMATAPIIYDWMTGRSMAAILTRYPEDIEEGSLLRLINRVVEALKDLYAVSVYLLGASDPLSVLVNLSITKIAREEAFLPSVYFQQ